jgi:hypothetical protein
MVQRKLNRVTAAVGVIIDYEGKPKPGMTRNISPGGLFFSTSAPLPNDAFVTVTIVHASMRLKCRACVVNSQEDGFGVEFREASAEFERGMHELLTKLTGKETGEFEEIGKLKPTDIAWSFVPEGFSVKNLWHLRERKAKVTNLSVEGAFIQSRNCPVVGEKILIYLGDDKNMVYCKARIVRHGEKGFAVQFIQPKREFRQAVSRLRQN